jgi:hypothetical protein
MPRPALLVRRSVLLPTAWGWLVLAILAAAALLTFVRGVHGFLAPRQGVGAELLVVEGWLDSDGLDQAVEVARSGGYRRILTSGGPITSWSELLGFSSHAELAADYLVRSGLPAGSVIAVPAPASAQDRTFLSAVEVRDWLQREGLTPARLDVLSSGCHARRTRLLYRMAFGPDTEVGILAARPGLYEPERWWRTSVGAKTVLLELASLLWTELCFWPGPPGSAEERWAVPAESAAPIEEG